MRITNRSVHHQCEVQIDPLRMIRAILLEDLGNGSVVTCDVCGQHLVVWRQEILGKGRVEFERITKRHRMLLWFTANTKAYVWIMRRWGNRFEG